ncbi:MSC_0621 family F1-like ATPase epsilon subunit [Mesomycoplasma bovoculi]|uniref:Uncharacterized protein n=1 Tax=Mesomycoplasma bovoculi M165/69 TaxID=743966 RepID=W5USW3_9BACT|nr:hypothetical protein [Mesomycoplasma bovoculi]AHH45222.1 hypothetical protein MYB_01055 [Mesomycoplasma bovoculi M165/69]
MKAQLWNLNILTNEQKHVYLKGYNVFLNVDQEKQFSELKKFNAVNQKFCLLKLVKGTKSYYIFAHNSLIYSLEKDVMISLSVPLEFYKSDKKAFAVHKDEFVGQKQSLLTQLQNKAILDLNKNYELFSKFYTSKLVSDEIKLKELFSLVKTEVLYD